MSIPRKTTFLFLLVFQMFHLNAQLNVEFSKTFGASSNDFYTGIGYAGDEEVSIIGYSSSNYGIFSENEGNYDLVIHKLGQDGQLIDHKSEGSIFMDVTEDAINIEERLYVSSYTTTPQGINASIKVFDESQNKLNEFTINNDGNEYPRNMIATNTGDLLICGNTRGALNKFGGGDIFLKKMSTQGNLIWEKSFGGQLFDSVNSMFELNDGSIMLVGFTYSKDGIVDNSFGKKDAWVMMLTANGDFLWSRNLGSDQFEAMVDLVEDVDGIILAGNQGLFDLSNPLSNGIYHTDIWLVKLDRQGNLQWEKHYGGKGDEKVHHIMRTNDGFLLTASTDSNDGIATGNKGKTDALILNMDGSGNIKNSLLQGGEGKDELNHAFQDRFGHIWLVGSTDSKFGDINESFGNRDGWVVKLNGSPPSFSVNLGQDRSICQGETITLDATIAGCDCEYLWTDGTSSPTNTLSPEGNLEMGITIRDALGNVAEDNINIQVNLLPQANLITEPISCAGLNDASINLNIISGDSPFQTVWSNGSLLEDLNQLGPGEYSVVVTDGNGCSNTLQAEIDDTTPLQLTADITQLNCNGQNEGAIRIEASGGKAPYTYAWNNGSVADELLDLASGIYEVSLSDANGCQIIESYTLNSISGISIEIDVLPVTCFGGNDGQIQVLIEGGSGEYELEWNNGATSEILEGLEAGFYVLNLMDSNGCEALTQVQVHEPEEFILTASLENETCFDAGDGSIDLQVQGGTGAYTYEWSNEQNAPIQELLSAGSYSVTVYDERLCQVTETFVLDELEPLRISSHIEDVKCLGASDGSIGLSVNGNQGAVDVLWNTGQSALELMDIGPGSYQVTISDQNDCTATESYVIRDGEDIEATFEVEKENCYASGDALINIPEILGNGPFEIQWDSPNNTGTTSLEGLTAGLYELSISDVNNCIKAFEIEVEATEQIQADLSLENVICHGDETGTASATITGGAEPYQYEWLDADATSLASSNAVSELAAGNYSLIITDANECQELFEFEIEENPLLNPNADITDVSCPSAGDGALSINLENLESYSFEWSTGDDAAMIEGLDAGTYDLSITDALSCETVYQFFITEPEPFELIYGLQDETCFGENNGEIAVAFSGGTAPYMYEWSNGSTERTIEELEPGFYELYISDADNCDFDTSFTIEAATEIDVEVDLNDADQGEHNGSIELIIEGGALPYRINWDNGGSGPLLSALSPGTYGYTLTDGNGCEKIGSYEINELRPNAILNTPNGSLVVYPNPSSGLLQVKSSASLALAEITIYDVRGREMSPAKLQKMGREIMLDLNHLLSGVYFVEIKESNTISRVKIIIQK